MKRMPRLLSAFAVIAMLLGSGSIASAKTVIRMATLAPANSSWVKSFKKAAKKIKDRTNGEVVIRIYPGGVQGDEDIAVAKMKSGSLQAAAVTAVGLSKISKDVLVMQAPGLLTNTAKLDKVRKGMQRTFEKSMEKNGFIVLGWADVGILNVYSNRPIRTPKDLRDGGVKLWLWNSDPIVPKMARILKKSGVSVGVPDVLPALNTGRINTLLGSPYACHTLQWCSKMKYRTDLPMGATVGAIVMNKKVFDGLSPEHQAIVREEHSKAARKLIRKVRRLNKKTLKLLNTKIETVPLTAGEIAEWKELFTKAQNALAGPVYSKANLKRARKLSGWK
ncbi:MAG: hypothetical protein CMH54_10525 [Myxococcales bacterium]|nr:hypothetical protein [Myxococcales bacterium]|tara:strand:+ start:2450 stop:3451 length:1002 start_codon:yes stop_codon:yes gene_type:complete